MNKIEICCGSYNDALNAFSGGAQRIELNSALHLGGLTPSLASLINTKNNTNLEVICMVRNRAAGFNYNDDEIKIMLDDAKILLDNQADGIAFGFLNNDYSINIEATKKMIELIHSYHKSAVFHRAIDVCNNYHHSIETLIDLKIDRILTSGQKAKAIEAKAELKKIQALYGSKIEILAGSGINEFNINELIEDTKIKQFHSSCKDYLIDTTTSNKFVSYQYLNNNNYEIVSKEKVSKLIKASIK